MTADHSSSDPQDHPLERPKRRPRYSGTHPRQFEHKYKELNPEAYPDMSEHVRAQGRTPAGTHIPVLVEELLAAVEPETGDVVLDCTLGFGGHAGVILDRIGSAGRLIGLDVDAAQLERATQRLGGVVFDPNQRAASGDPPTVSTHRLHFAGVGKVLSRERLDGFDIIYADLGVSSMQIDDPARGFSYKHDGPLDMRMDDRLPKTAADYLATLSVRELSDCLREFADEPLHERIAKAIVEYLTTEPIKRSRQLARLILRACQPDSRKPKHRAKAPAPRLHPAARTFQALRILVNDEMTGLEQMLRAVPYCLRPGGRIGVISFHSGEHRRVHDAFAEGIHAGLYAAMSSDPIRPTPREAGENPRSRSARLQWARRAAV